MSTKGMDSGAKAPEIRRNYKAASKFQWVREATVNSLQANATYIEFTTEWEAVAQLGVYRRVILDNGDAMLAPQMPGFINKYGGSGRTIGATTENYGVGLKSSTLTWNQYGLVVISKKEDASGVTGVHMMWLHLDPTYIVDGMPDYGAREITTELLDLSDPDDQDWLADWSTRLGTAAEHSMSLLPLHEFSEVEIDGVDWVKVASALDPYDHGTMIVMLGGTDANSRGQTDDTVLGDPNRDESGKYGIVEYLNKKLWEMPKGVTIHVSQYELHGLATASGARDKSQWPINATDPRGTRQSRKGRSLSTDIERAFAKHGQDRAPTMTIPVSPTNPVEVDIDVLLFKRDIDRRDAAGVPFLATLFTSHSTLTGVISETFDSTDQYTDLNKWCEVKAVTDRMVILLTPRVTPGVEVFPNSSRGALLYDNDSDGGLALPMNVWSDYFKKNPPDVIAQAIKDYYNDLSANGDDGLNDEDYDRLGQRWGEALRYVIRLVPSKKATGRTGVVDKDAKEHERSGRRSKRKRPSQPVTTMKEDPSATGPVRDKRVGVHLIEVLPGVETDMSDPAFALKLDTTAMKAVLNVDHSYYIQAQSSILAKYAHRITTPAVRDGVIREFKKQALAHCSLAVTAQWNLAKAHPGKRLELLDEASLTAAMGGVRHLMQAAEPGIQTLLTGRTRRRTAKAAGTAKP